MASDDDSDLELDCESLEFQEEKESLQKEILELRNKLIAKANHYADTLDSCGCDKRGCFESSNLMTGEIEDVNDITDRWVKEVDKKKNKKKNKKITSFFSSSGVSVRKLSPKDGKERSVLTITVPKSDDCSSSSSSSFPPVREKRQRTNDDNTDTVTSTTEASEKPAIELLGCRLVLFAPTDENRLPRYVAIDGVSVEQFNYFVQILELVDKNYGTGTQFIAFLDPDKPLADWRNFTDEDMIEHTLLAGGLFEEIKKLLGEDVLDRVFLSKDSHAPTSFEEMTDEEMLKFVKQRIPYLTLYVECAN